MARFFLLLILLVLGACGKSSSNETKEQRNGDSKEKLVKDDSVRVSVVPVTELNKSLTNWQEFKQNINRFNVYFHADTGNFSGFEIVCGKGMKSLTKTKFNQKGTLAEMQLTISEIDPTLVHYECSITDQGSLITKTNFTLKKSFVIEGIKSYLGYIGGETIGTLILEKGSVLVTNGADLNVEMDALVSNGGKIVTFTEDQLNSTGPDRSGRSGGTLKIKSLAGHGKVIFVLRGMNGGIPTQVPPVITKIPPPDPTTNGKCSNRRDLHNPNCYGKKGTRGYKGSTGLQGLPGGDSGVLLLTVFEAPDLEIEVIPIPGKGGKGGLGGQGGKGGPGGKGSIITWESYGGCGREGPCSSRTNVVNLPNGPVGDQGPQGDEGPQGPEGTVLESEVVLNDRNLKFNFDYHWKNF